MHRRLSATLRRLRLTVMSMRDSEFKQGWSFRVQQESSAGATRFLVLAWLTAAAAIAYISRNSLTVAEKSMRGDMQLSEEAMGVVLGPAFFWTYALAQIPTGWMAQRWGARWVLPAMSVLSSLATAALGWVQSLPGLIAARMVAGLGQAGLFPASTQTIARWHPATERAMASGALAAAMSLGGALGAFATGWLLEEGRWSWKSIFVLWAVPGLAWAVGFAWWFRDRPEPLHTPGNWPSGPESKPPDASTAKLSGVGSGLQPAASDSSQVRTNVSREAINSTKIEQQPLLEPQGARDGAHRDFSFALSVPLWLICGQQFFRAGGYAFFTSWFATYLQETRAASTAQSGLLTTIPLLAIVTSSLLGGMASDAVFRITKSVSLARRGLAACALTLSAACVAGMYFIQHTPTAMAVLAAGVFFSGLAGPCAYAVTMDLGGKQVAVLFGTMNMVGNFGAGLLPWIVPHWRRFWEAHPAWLGLVGGNSWHAVLWLFAATYLAAALCWLALRSDRPIISSV